VGPAPNVQGANSGFIHRLALNLVYFQKFHEQTNNQTFEHGYQVTLTLYKHRGEQTPAMQMRASSSNFQRAVHETLTTRSCSSTLLNRSLCSCSATFSTNANNTSTLDRPNPPYNYAMQAFILVTSKNTPFIATLRYHGPLPIPHPSFQRLPPMVIPRHQH
jgi:hypothetical protein